MAKGLRKERSGRRRRRRVVRSLTLRDLIRYRWELKRGARRLVRKRKGAVLPFPSSHRHPSDRTRCSQSNQPSDLKNLPESSAGRGRIQKPWKNLPEPFTGMLLEKLPLPDYITFGSVCKGWHNIQINHKLARSPHPPLLPPVPWFVLTSLGPDMKGPDETVSPFEEKRGQKGVTQRYWLPNPCFLPGSRRRLSFQGTCTGWHVLSNCGVCFYLYNPISKCVISLPPLRRLCYSYRAGLGLSKCFASPPPHYAVCVQTRTELFLIREEDKEWVQIAAFFTNTNTGDGWFSHERPRQRLPFSRTVSFGGNLYGLLTTKRNWNIYVVYPRPSPTTQEFEMDTSQLPTPFDDEEIVCPYLVESNGQLLLVLEVTSDRYRTIKFQVFRADFSKKTWIQTKSLGDQSIVLRKGQGVSFRASCFRDGVRENCIYFCPFHDPIWRMFDLSSGEAMECPLLRPNLVRGWLLVPALF